jgi:hypothetical protein
MKGVPSPPPAPPPGTGLVVGVGVVDVLDVVVDIFVGFGRGLPTPVCVRGLPWAVQCLGTARVCRQPESDVWKKQQHARSYCTAPH